MPRFVVLEHDHPQQHWDLMLEAGAVLRTWRLDQPLGCGQELTAAAVFDHRLHYLDYEGPISGNRGRVIRRERGTFTGEAEGDQEIIVQLEGERLRGTLRLQHEDGDRWRGEFHAEATEQ